MVSGRFGRDLYDLCVLRSFEVYLFLGIFIGDLAEIESQRVTARSESACVGANVKEIATDPYIVFACIWVFFTIFCISFGTA